MLLAATLAALSAAIGGALAIGARRRPALLERTRTFAFAAAAGVVAFHLLPEILPEQGLVALLWIAVGFALPWLLEFAARMLGPGLLKSRGFTGARVAAEVGFAALLFHSLVEGLALVAALAGPGKLDLEIALVAHHAPLTAAVVLPFLDLLGPRSTARRAAIVGATGIAGVLASRFVPGLDSSLLQQATAVTAGALLHVVSDEIRAQEFASPWERGLDVAACVGGLLVAGLSAVLHLRDHAAAGPLLEFLRVLGGLSLKIAGPLLVGLVAAAFVARPRLDAPLLAAILLGPAAAVVVLAASFALPASPPSLAAAVRDRAPRILALLFVAAALAVSEMRGDALSQAIVLVILLGASRLDEAGAVIVAAVLVGRGVHPGLAIGLLALGPVLHGVRARVSGWPRIAALWLAGAAAALALGFLAGRIETAPRSPVDHRPFSAQLSAHPADSAAAALLVALALFTLWSAGVRGWFAPLRHRS